VGLKGSDGAAIQRRARALGAVPRAQERARQALERLGPARDGVEIEIVTCPGEMGADAARASGFEPSVIGVGSITPGETTAEDTRRAARAMVRRGVDLLLFAGGDGTARDIYAAVGERVPALGIPAGVKIHSAVYAANPASAGDLAGAFLAGRVSRLREAEVMDIDEEAVRRGVVSARLYGYLQVPFERRMLQGLKTPTRPGERAAQQAIGAAVARKMATDDCLYVVGPGTTTRAIAERLGVQKTLLGVDVFAKDALVAADVNESQLLALLEEGRRARIVVTPIGGQGYIFGRGNQQISPRVIRRMGPEHILVVGTIDKIHALGGQPLLVDTGDRSLDQILIETLRGYVKVITGYHEQIVYRVAC
ncbi:MAG TPA: ATP-NAD kinase, partial [Chloroflexi bacterium]|nr:ATP-NAD kinase [Chloroflexota bacterium]